MCWERRFGPDGLRLKFPHLPKPRDDQESRVAFKILQSYDETINLVQRQIAEIENRILHTE